MNNNILYAKTTQDTIFAINLNVDTVLWATDMGYGKDIAATQLMVDGNTLFATTKNGLVLALDALTGDTLWQHKLGNSLLTTPCTLSDSSVVVASTDGTIALLEKRLPIPLDTLAVDSLMLDSLAFPVDSLMLPIESTAIPIDTVKVE